MTSCLSIKNTNKCLKNAYLAWSTDLQIFNMEWYEITFCEAVTNTFGIFTQLITLTVLKTGNSSFISWSSNIN